MRTPKRFFGATSWGLSSKGGFSIRAHLQKQAEGGSAIMQLDIAKLATLKVRPMERAVWWGPFGIGNWR